MIAPYPSAPKRNPAQQKCADGPDEAGDRQTHEQGDKRTWERLPPAQRPGMALQHLGLPPAVSKVLARQLRERAAREVRAPDVGIQHDRRPARPRPIVELVVFVRDQPLVEAAEGLPGRLAKASERHRVDLRATALGRPRRAIRGVARADRVSHGPRYRPRDSTRASWHDLPDAAADAGPGLAERLDGPPHVVRLRKAMTVQPDDHLSARRPNREVHRCGDTDPRHGNPLQSKARMPPTVARDNLRRRIRRASVDDDNLVDRCVLTSDGVEQGLDPPRLVSAGDNERHSVPFDRHRDRGRRRLTQHRPCRRTCPAGRVFRIGMIVAGLRRTIRSAGGP